jgi:purine nucleoside permease
MEWCRAWVRYWTGGQGTFATSAMEDSGVMRALRSLDAAGKVDVQRALVLRTASNFVRLKPWKHTSRCVCAMQHIITLHGRD